VKDTSASLAILVTRLARVERRFRLIQKNWSAPVVQSVALRSAPQKVDRSK